MSAGQMVRSGAAGEPRRSVVVAVARRFAASRWCWVLALVVLVAARHLLGPAPYPLAPTFGDTDDALRLLQVREFLAHGNWFDTHLERIGAPEGLASHWSRLVDAGLAAVILVLALVADLPAAELATEIVWPLLLLALLTRFVMGEAERRGGPWAAVMVLALVLASPTALSQFLPGRIDHHNVQIMCAVIAVFLLARAMRAPRHGWAAGAVMALGLVVGLEALPLMAAILAFACLISCFDPAARPGIVRALAALLAGLLAGYVLTVPPSGWLAVSCDMLAPNLIALVAAGTVAGLLMHWRLPRVPGVAWLAGYGVAAAVGVAGYWGANPACMAGAFADVDPLVHEAWLANVMESYSIARFAVASPTVAISYVVVVALGVLAAIWQARESWQVPDMFLAIATVLAALYGCYYIKFMSYGVWLALVQTAIVLARLPSIGEMPARLSRIAALVFCNQMTALALAGIALGLFAPRAEPAAASDKPSFTALAATCAYKSDIRRLRRLQPGLVLSNLDLGPYIALATPHHAVAGPYHRIHPAIKRMVVALRAPLDEAERHLREIGADYVVLCAAPDEAGGTGMAGEPATLSRHLRSGGGVPYLEEVDLGVMQGPLKVWKVRPAA